MSAHNALQRYNFFLYLDVVSLKSLSIYSYFVGFVAI